MSAFATGGSVKGPFALVGERPSEQYRTCERYSRNHGGAYKINCYICGRGPCQHNAYKDARDVPNRLYGATINHEGEAI